MGLKCNISVRKASVVVSFFLVVLSQRIFASGLSIQSKYCGSDHISYLIGSSHDFFYINGRLVDKYLFCNALKYYHANHCFITDDDLNHLCGLGLSLDELPLDPGRKFLHKLVREESARHNFLENSQPTEERDTQKSLLAPKMAVAASGMFILCCSFLCPCFRARRKQADHTVLTKDLQSMDSVSSLEMNPAPEKIPGSPLRVPGSPLRVPGSPLRVPGSPLRVPPSPARFSMSPKVDRIGSVHLNINQAVRATQNFSPSMMLGEGGYGTVYKARLQDGQIVAIKRAKKEHFEALRMEFSSEVQLLSKIDHRNLVKLLGYLDKGNERLIITEYVPNGTLREHLDGMRGKILDFNQRLEISIDVAHALTYLHLYSVKHPALMAFKKYDEGNVREIVDPLMQEVVDEDILMKMFELGFQCAAPTRSDRPDMKAVGEQLWAVRMDYLRSGRRG
ncbi:hypothetical protein RHGRI_000517 [Rhododendron griersonianum]|uniref:Protein kinase domain-containing protein n=1 Tax=Rhododendron griersonianum TaxID=479676 RepID=A0AAV6LJ29_9ERIC|nr:hypothetical protein RHGRI_000517 [Rhododendron griersonianum]KAG5564345.1 hypothetical protein RHGRI_000517 [Rhododendron griersonianum]